MSEQIYAAITAWGFSVPEKVLTNHDLERMVDTSDEWIRSRTGIGERHIVAEGQYTSTLSLEAARKTLAQANLDPRDLDLIIVATATPDYPFPATACLVQEQLGATRAAAFDIEAACSGFLYALTVGSQFIKTGAMKNVLVIGAETLSRFVNWTDRTTCVLFADGAGAALLQPSTEESGILSFMMGSSGEGAELIIERAGGSRYPSNAQDLPQEKRYIHMAGQEVFKLAVTVMGNDAMDAITRAGIHPADIDLFIPHQANVRIIEAMAKRFELPMGKFFVNIERYGNTSAASIPIAICEAVEQGILTPGTLLCIAAFGAGLTHGAAVIRWNPQIGAK